MNLEFLKKIVEIDSRTENVCGVNKVQKIFADHLIELGFAINWLQKNQDKTGDLLWAQRKGTSPRAITLVCHADTVLGPSEKFNFHLDFENQKAIGPGIGDNKGGIALILGALTDLLEFSNGHFYTINVVSSPCEETGSIGFHDFFEKIGRESDFIFGFEPALKNGDIINERAGNRWYQINIKGKSGHAGRWQDESINAAHIGAELINSLIPLISYEDRRRVNVAAFNGGSEKYNVICEQVEIKLDTRFNDFYSQQLIHNEIINNLDIIKQKYDLKQSKVEYHVSLLDDCPPLPRKNLATEIANKIIEKVYQYESRKISASFSGGAADINYFQNIENVGLDGLGPIAGNMHRLDEYIELESFYSRRKIITEILIEINHKFIEVIDEYFDDYRTIN